MSATFLLLALPVAAVSAFRGVWSPCGLSMLSSITPMTEAGRGNRFRTTAAWFVLGGLLGGLSLGLLAAAGAAGLAALGPSTTALLGIGAAVAVATAAIDLGVLGIELPIFKRQVNDAWLRQYRSWAYGAGFGWQIGFGVATYIMTAGVFLTIALAVVSASPALALTIGATFGLVRGSAVFLGRSATSPAALGRVHERLDAAAPAARAAAAGVQVLAAAVLAGLALHPLAGAAVLAAAAIVVVVNRPGLRPAAS
ncbi:hypothetical protein KSP35_04030 [Aquihabitans sp. G128]|uniref:hypothetical protein n=1 Tax=Aquihabitans sp. G128 TaxID=2849779 RepID=UPI001C22D480|nr:hypothetical protein [Aquihabitans sp. G128]QXC61995.1 hypothetical protein KSP35_04030 [Aquihabitans sp. G128]